MPTPLTLDLPELQNNEALKGFDSTDALASAYLKVAGGSVDVLPDDIKNEPSFKASNFKTTADVAKAFIDTKKLVGTIKHAPAKPEDYKFSTMEGMHPNLKVEPEVQKEFMAECHKAGISNDQADAMYKWQMGLANRRMQAVEKASGERAQTNETALRKEWGADYDKNMANIVNMLTAAGGEDMIKELAPQLKNAPAALKAFAKIAGLLSEDGIKSLGPTSSAQVSGADETAYNEYAKAISSNDQKHPLMNDRDPGHQKAVEEWTRLSTIHATRPAA
jgi:hypothetical protein